MAWKHSPARRMSGAPNVRCGLGGGHLSFLQHGARGSGQGVRVGVRRLWSAETCLRRGAEQRPHLKSSPAGANRGGIDRTKASMTSTATSRLAESGENSPYSNARLPLHVDRQSHAAVRGKKVGCAQGRQAARWSLPFPEVLFVGSGWGRGRSCARFRARRLLRTSLHPQPDEAVAARRPAADGFVGAVDETIGQRFAAAPVRYARIRSGRSLL